MALTYYVNLMGLFKSRVGNIPRTSFKSDFGSLPIHRDCTKWNAEIQVFSSVPCHVVQAMLGNIYNTAFRLTLSLIFRLGKSTGRLALAGPRRPAGPWPITSGPRAGPQIVESNWPVTAWIITVAVTTILLLAGPRLPQTLLPGQS